MSLIAGNLSVVQKLLDGASMQWGVFGGSAAHYYGSRRPINDIDILVPVGSLSNVAQMLQRGQRAVQFDGGRILWRGIVLQDDITIRQGTVNYPFQLDQPMIDRLRRKSLLGAKVLFLAPEDVVIHKLIQYRGAEQNKHDVVDVEGIIKRQELDHEYLRYRLNAANASDLVLPRLSELGVALEASTD